MAAAAAFSLDAAALSHTRRGPTVNVAPLVAGSADFVGLLREGTQLRGTTRQLNVVPDRTVIEGELRFLKPSEGDAVLAGLRTIADRVAAVHDVTTSFTSSEAVSPVDPHGPGGGAGGAGGGAGCPARLEVEEDRGGISFPNVLPCTGALPVLDGLGAVGSGVHTHEERLTSTSLSRRIDLLANLLAEL